MTEPQERTLTVEEATLAYPWLLPPRPPWYDRPDMAWVDRLDPKFLLALTGGTNGPIPPPERTLGPQWVKWIERNCVMGEGDMAGVQARVAPFQRALLWKLAEIQPSGRRRYSFAIVSMGKGAGKSPLGAWVGNIDLAGPSVVCDGRVLVERRLKPCPKCQDGWLPNGRPHAVMRRSPWVLNMAASYDQADLILDEIRVTWTEGPLAEHAQAMKGEVTLKGGRGRANRIPATKKRADGSKATTLLVDEAHELTSEIQEGAYDVAAAGTGKRQDGLVLIMSTAGYDLTTLFGRKVIQGLSGKFGTGSLLVYTRAPDGLDPSNPEDIARGITAANPLVAAGIANVHSLVQQFISMPVFRAKRYFWNLWTKTDESWLPVGAWDACKADERVPMVFDPSLPTWVGADMALRRDSAAVVIVQRRDDGRIQASSRIWYPDGDEIDQSECDDYIRSIKATYNLKWVAADEAWWPTLGKLEGEGIPIFRMPQQGRNMVLAYTQTYRVIVDQILLHDGSPDFSDQISSAVPQSTDGGWRLRKGKHKKRIDSAPALSGAIFASTQPDPEPEPAPLPPSEVY